MKLIVENLSKTYKKRKVVNDVSFSVRSGEAVGILGPNGAGKTTCFSMVAGLVKPDSGKVYAQGEDITMLPMHKRSIYGISYLPQESSIFRGLNVEQNIMAILEHTEKDVEMRTAKLEELLGDFGISHLKYADSTSLSGGERRRLEIGRALATNPKFILLDEPLAGIDPIAVSDIKQLILKLKDRNLGILITDHNVRETLEMVDRAYIIFEGKVLFEGTPLEIAKSKIVRDVYLGKSFSF